MSSLKLCEPNLKSPIDEKAIATGDRSVLSAHTSDLFCFSQTTHDR